MTPPNDDRDEFAFMYGAAVLMRWIVGAALVGLVMLAGGVWAAFVEVWPC
jgi:hypothetical protein